MTVPSKKQAAPAALLSAAAAACFAPLFIFQRVGPLDFWWSFSLVLALLTGLGFFLERRLRTGPAAAPVLGLPAAAGLGVLSAAVLYLVFFGGGFLISVLLPASRHGIDSVYALKASASVLRVSALLLLVIGPGEELFWRRLLQRRYEALWGGRTGWLAAAALYTAVHAGSGNPLLVLAAGVCGLFWGYLYLRFRSVVLNAVSHALWDVAVFILWPVL